MPAEPHQEGGDQQSFREAFLYPLQLIFPKFLQRVIYFRSKEEQQRWQAALKLALQQTTIEDHLSLEGHTLG
jgi:hypothetical protein